MIRLVSEKIVPLTMELALSTATAHTVPGERDPNKHARVEALLRDFRQGIMRPFDWAFATLHGERFRVNGGTTSNLFAVRNDIPFPKDAIVHLTEYSCDTMGDLLALWRCFDTGPSSRNSTDIRNTIIENTKAFQGKNKNFLTLAANAMAQDEFGFNQTNKTTIDQRLALLTRNLDFLDWLNDLPKPTIGSKNLFSRVGVVHGMLRCWQYDQASCKQFWRVLSTQKYEPSQKYPAGGVPNPQGSLSRLRDWLIVTDTDFGGGCQTKRQKATWQIVSGTSFSAFLGWRDGDKSRTHIRTKAIEPPVKANAAGAA